MAIELPDDATAEIVASIRRYFLEERGEEIGDLQAGFLLEFIVKEIGPSIYNKAVADTQARLREAVADIDATLHEPEFGYTAERLTKRNRR